MIRPGVTQTPPSGESRLFRGTEGQESTRKWSAQAMRGASGSQEWKVPKTGFWAGNGGQAMKDHSHLCDWEINISLFYYYLNFLLHEAVFNNNYSGPQMLIHPDKKNQTKWRNQWESCYSCWIFSRAFPTRIQSLKGRGKDFIPLSPTFLIALSILHAFNTCLMLVLMAVKDQSSRHIFNPS